MLADRFTEVFRQEHRQVRDLLLGLIDAFEGRDLPRARELLGRVAALTGPHFRFGGGYIEELFRAHDRAIAGARRLVELAGKAELTDDEVAEAVGIVRGILPHVSDCDGLSIMVERLPEAQVQAILDRREAALAAGLDLLRWAETVRRR